MGEQSSRIEQAIGPRKSYKLLQNLLLRLFYSVSVGVGEAKEEISNNEGSRWDLIKLSSLLLRQFI